MNYNSANNGVNQTESNARRAPTLAGGAQEAGVSQAAEVPRGYLGLDENNRAANQSEGRDQGRAHWRGLRRRCNPQQRPRR